MTDTHFAPAERASTDELARQVSFVSGNPVIDGLMDSVGGMLAVLNEHRQVLALNHSLLASLSIDDPRDALGLRIGEAVGCVHADDEPAGCGTTRFCGTCGAAIATVASLAEDRPAERVCAIVRERDGEREDLFFSVRTSPVKINDERLLLIFLRNITTEHQRAALERVFFHDISNMITGLLGASSTLAEETRAADPLVADIHHLSVRLADEIRIQRCLSHAEQSRYVCSNTDVDIPVLLGALRSVFGNHSAAEGRQLAVTQPDRPSPVRTDSSLLLRVLVNMVINALEASQPGDEVRVAAEQDETRTSFSVWNRAPIPQDIALRVFQRHFSTKGGSGRGIGTYSMKLLGERYLGGCVDFTSTEDAGTTFRISLPAR